MGNELQRGARGLVCNQVSRRDSERSIIPSGSGVLLISHGSRDVRARADFQEQVFAVRAALPEKEVRAAVLEFPGEDLPSIRDAAATLVRDGFYRLVVLPMFLFDAGHVRTDIPAELARARQDIKGIGIDVLPQIDVSDGLLDVLIARLGDLQAGNKGSECAALIVGAGTSSANANAELYRVGRLLWERKAAALVEVAFVSLTSPSIADGLARCAMLGARQVVILPYFLNTGVLARRILPAAEKVGSDLGLSVRVAAEIGAHPALIDALAARLNGAISGDLVMGHEEQAQNDQCKP